MFTYIFLFFFLVNASHQQAIPNYSQQPAFNQQNDNYTYSQQSLHHSNFSDQDQQMMYYQQQQQQPQQQIQQQYNNTFVQQNHYPNVQTENPMPQNVIHHQLPHEQSNVISSNFNYPTSSDKQTYNQQLINPHINMNINVTQNQLQQSVINKPSSATTQSASNQVRNTSKFH